MLRMGVRGDSKMPGSLLLEKSLLSASGRRRTPHVQATSMSVPYTALKFEDFASASPGEELQPLQEKFLTEFPGEAECTKQRGLKGTSFRTRRDRWP